MASRGNTATRIISDRLESSGLATLKTKSYLVDSNTRLFNLQYHQAIHPRHSPDTMQIEPLLSCTFIQTTGMSTRFTNMATNLAPLTTILTGGLIASAIIVAPALAQNLPNWEPRSICSNDSAKGQCLLFEQRAQNDVTASWSILPQATRASCLTRFTPPLEPSWRILGDCIEIEGRRAQQLRASAQKIKEEKALALLSAARSSSVSNQQSGSEQEGPEQSAAMIAADRKRIADEEASFMARLAEQRRADNKAASAKAALKAKMARAETERKRVEAEEASFMALLAEQQRADAASRQKALASKSKTAEQKTAEIQRTEAERRRVADEEASFMAQLAAQRRIDAEAAERKARAKTQAVAAARAKSAQSCQARLRQIQSSGVIQFAFNRASIANSKGIELLDKLAEAAGKCEGQLSITVEGHTDSQGAAAANNRLSEARAQTVADYLRNKGVPADRISARGFGSSKPVASNRASAGRAKNRRIEFKVK